jgi:hypothetical protein
MTQHTPVVADEGFDVLAHINPRSPTFYRDCATVAAYMIHGEGQAFGRCVLTAAIMHHVMQAARENRTRSLSEVHSTLSDVNRKIRRLTRGRSQRNTTAE